MKGMPGRVLVSAVLCALLSSAALADVPNRPKEAVRDAIVPHGIGGATGQCSVVYYNICSGWMWLYSGWEQGDEAGVAF
ncbi:MAG: hypothetical protein ABIH26_09100, partial [Candidatus Eisenbacteria bacterium]